MINTGQLLRDLQKLLKDLEADLQERSADLAEIDEDLRKQHAEAKQGGRTGVSFEAWRDEYLTQVAVAWILGCVFVRFLEDNGLVETPYLSGPGSRRQLALDQHELYFKEPDRRTDSDREYLLYVFEKMRTLPAARAIFDSEHNPLWALGISGDGATKLLGFWQRLDPETGHPSNDFTDPEWSTRFLGDLYQDLSESARKRYALLQTPEFVEEFILDRTLTPAIEEFGFQEVRLIDPTCGSGHFLLGAFHRLLDLWVKDEPGANTRELAQRALSQVHGVDVNPFAVSIANFRLLVAALKACDIHHLKSAPAFELNLATGDSLLHGRGLLGAYQRSLDESKDPLRHVYQTEDAGLLRRILGQPYHAVVGNPPYITVKDKALNEAYRSFYSSCHRKYSLGVPFTQRFFELAIEGGPNDSGFVGMITANSFMKREFGKKLIENTLPKLDLTHVIDTSGAYIPGHGTPTVILLGRNRRPVADSIRAAMGIRGEPSTPEDPAQGQVWKSIVTQLDSPGSEGDFISVADYPRARFERHPWSLGGGGAAELKELIERAATNSLGQIVDAIGVFGMTNADDAMLAPQLAFARRGVEPSFTRPLVLGDQIRDWTLNQGEHVVFPYDVSGRLQEIGDHPGLHHWLWPVRTVMGNRATFSKATYFQENRPWWEWHQVAHERLRSPLTITFAFVATHNHFVLDRGGKVFKQSAPVIKLPPDATEDDHLALLALLNSSTACFWMKQVFHDKGVGGIGGGIGDENWEPRYEHDGTKIQQFPVVERNASTIAKRLLDLGAEIAGARLIAVEERIDRKAIDAMKSQTENALLEAIGLQEELDWLTYHAYGICDENLCFGRSEAPSLSLGHRAFEISMAREG